MRPIQRGVWAWPFSASPQPGDEQMRTKRATNAWSLRWHMTALLAASLIATAARAQFADRDIDGKVIQP